MALRTESVVVESESSVADAVHTAQESVQSTRRTGVRIVRAAGVASV